METHLAFIGFGEAASTFAGAPAWQGSSTAFDIDPGRKVAMVSCGIEPAGDARVALERADIILSLVTADQALAAASSSAPFLKAGALWIDMNSVAPATKRDASQVIVGAGGAYVDAAILAPVQPAVLNAPVLVSGPEQDLALKRLTQCGFTNVRCAGEEIGKASAIKMIRSIMVKGIEALTAEMMEAADAEGVVDEVLSSLDASASSTDWHTRAAYNLERMATHGTRRAAEMEEVAATLTSLGVEPIMTRGTVQRQSEAAHKSTQKRDVA